jgi:hypothetical protein
VGSSIGSPRGSSRMLLLTTTLLCLLNRVGTEALTTKAVVVMIEAHTSKRRNTTLGFKGYHLHVLFFFGQKSVIYVLKIKKVIGSILCSTKNSGRVSIWSLKSTKR